MRNFGYAKCDTPKKAAYVAIGDATRAALKVYAEYGKVQRPYGDCACGYYHLTSHPYFDGGELTIEQLLFLADSLHIEV